MTLRSTLGAVALWLCTGAAAFAQQQAQCGVTQTVVVLAAGVPAPINAQNTQRRGLEWQNVGANPVTIAPGATATVGQGLVLAPGASGSLAGGSEKYFSGPVPANAFAAVSAAGTSLLVWECQ